LQRLRQAQHRGGGSARPRGAPDRAEDGAEPGPVARQLRVHRSAEDRLRQRQTPGPAPASTLSRAAPRRSCSRWSSRPRMRRAVGDGRASRLSQRRPERSRSANMAPIEVPDDLALIDVPGGVRARP